MRQSCALRRRQIPRVHGGTSPTSSGSASSPLTAAGGGVSTAPAGSGTASAPPERAPASAEGTPAPAAAVPVVQVTAVEYHYTLSRTAVQAGKVIFEFVNHGQDEHNLNVQPSTGPSAASLPTVKSGTISKLELELRPVSYTLFCSLPEHEAKGMKATLTVE